MIRVILLMCSVTAFLHPTLCLAGEPAGKIMLWDVYTDSGSWNADLNATGTRIGCSSPPVRCLSLYRRVAAMPGIDSIFIMITLDPNTALAYAGQYSELTVREPKIVELGIDDFVAEYTRLRFVDRAGFLKRVIDAAQGANPNLAFGITLYEDELDSPMLTDAELPASLRARIAYVHLYDHYRTDWKQYRADVARAAAMFPNAKIVAGVYALDRVNYIPCSPLDKRECTPADDLTLFKDLFDVQTDLLKDGKVAWLEFIPGYFGNAENWSGWRDSGTCAPTRLRECLSQTGLMREYAKTVLRQKGMVH